MLTNRIKTSFRIYASTREDLNQGWVWIGWPELPQRAFVRIENPATGDAVYCEALRIDDNFLNTCHQGRRIHISQHPPALVINEWFRTRLGGIVTKSDVELEVSISDEPLSWVC